MTWVCAGIHIQDHTEPWRSLGRPSTGAGGILEWMYRRIIGALSFLLYAAIMFPSIGPLVDHHFAERQLGHLHLYAGSLHVHSFDQPHSHDGEVPLDANALYNFDRAHTVNLFHTGDELGLTAFSLFQPNSLFVLPSGLRELSVEPCPEEHDRPPTGLA